MFKKLPLCTPNKVRNRGAWSLSRCLARLRVTIRMHQHVLNQLIGIRRLVMLICYEERVLGLYP